MIQKTLLTLTIAVSLISAAHAIPLRELIFQTMDQERHGVLTQQEITTARRLGARWHRSPGDYVDTTPRAKASARANFPHDVSKQKEWVLECSIGKMMASEAELWTP